MNQILEFLRGIFLSLSSLIFVISIKLMAAWLFFLYIKLNERRVWNIKSEKSGCKKEEIYYRGDSGEVGNSRSLYEKVTCISLRSRN